jgi:hypothetical protein
MKPQKLLFIVITGMIVTQFSGILHAQGSQPRLSLEKGTIANRFDYVIRESVVSDDSRVVKTWWLTRLKAHVADTIRGLHFQIDSTEKLLTGKIAQIDSLTIALEEIKNTLAVLEKEKNSIKFFWMPTSKKAYKSIMWSIVFGLIILTLIFFVLYKRSNIVTRQTRLTIEDLRREYEAHRKTAREREEKLSFNYHRELNKLKEKKP